MKLRKWGLFGLCVLMLCGCSNLSTTENTANDTPEDVSILSAGQESENLVDDEMIVDEEIVEDVIVPDEELGVETSKTQDTSKKTEKTTKETKSTETKKEETSTTVETPEPTPVPTTPTTPTPTEPPKEEPKEEPKVEEEKVYSGWHESDKAKTVFNKINEIRVNNGLSELPWSDSDTWLANTRVEELVNEVATNTVHSGLKKYDCYVGEIAGYGYSANGVVDAWMNSSGHANQILADYNTSMAVGVYYDEYTASSYYIVIFR